MANQIIYWTLLAGTLVFVLWRGGQPERTAIVAWTAASLLSTGSVELRLGSYDSVQFGVFAIDIVLLAAFVWLALRADRVWPLWVTGFHLVGVLTHVAKVLKPDLHPWAYAIGQAGGGYLVLAAITIGTLRHSTRVRKSGPERSWKASYSRSAS